MATKLKVLVVGGGGREHALCWALARSPSVGEVICAPGNAGIAEVARCVPVKADECVQVADLADAENVDLVVVGPEGPLVAGLADLLQARGRAVFGCSRAAAEIEGSKTFAKELMARHSIPTAAFGAFSQLPEAELFLDELMRAEGAERVVIKADGLAAGKGVVIAGGLAEAKSELRKMLAGETVGDAGRRVIIEEFLDGREASLMALVDGERVAPLVPAEDHKTVFDGDTGPMTGGMGVVSPTPVMSDLEVARAVREVLEPTARGLAAEGRPFRGLLYAGLMLTRRGPKVLEFNCRFGDPETQVLMARLDEDLGLLLHAVATGRPVERVRFSERAAVCVVMTAPGYPGGYPTGIPIAGLDAAARVDGVTVFHAGTRRDGDRIVTAGGRVLGVTAVGEDVDDARARAYRAVDAITFQGAHFRTDIGRRSP
ncbi:MAG: Phosphoribosylamine--glycine ligase [Myxococcales bacterium]|nr:Phosphoribosylamine--glycine ligase [Myxococcales bacterium]